MGLPRHVCALCGERVLFCQGRARPASWVPGCPPCAGNSELWRRSAGLRNAWLDRRVGSRPWQGHKQAGQCQQTCTRWKTLLSRACRRWTAGTGRWPPSLPWPGQPCLSPARLWGCVSHPQDNETGQVPARPRGVGRGQGVGRPAGGGAALASQGEWGGLVRASGAEAAAPPGVC